MKKRTRWQNKQLAKLQEGIQKRSPWLLLVEPEQKPSQHKGKDGSLRSSDSVPNKVNEYTGHRRTGSWTLQLLQPQNI